MSISSRVTQDNWSDYFAQFKKDVKKTSSYGDEKKNAEAKGKADKSDEKKTISVPKVKANIAKKDVKSPIVKKPKVEKPIKVSSIVKETPVVDASMEATFGAINADFINNNTNDVVEVKSAKAVTKKTYTSKAKKRQARKLSKSKLNVDASTSED